MNEDKSDVVFVVKGQRVPALKQFLSVRNNVFRAMFSDNFKESKDKTVVIEETSFEAFQTLILFLYSDRLVLKDENDVKFMEELFELSDRYEAIRLMRKITKKLTKIELTFKNFEQISSIAFRYKREELMPKVMEFIDKHFTDSIKEEVIQLCESNDATYEKLVKLFLNNYRKLSKEWFEIKEKKKILESRKCETCKIINPNVPTIIHYGGKSCSFRCQLCNKLITNNI